MRVAPIIKLDEQTECQLRALAKSRRVQARVQQRARIVLLAAQGRQNKDIALQVGLDRRQVALWRSRFLQAGIAALHHDAPRPGRTPTVTPEIQVHIVYVTLHEHPAHAAHWSSRTLAAHLGLGATTIRRVWNKHGIKPCLSRT
ncbi:MAG: helix-turn-helix domain-containing protein [Burkholderiaceae bacterium]|nr:helix-turn-helix domain-containing protein [Burkholderiaceae bacterium]